MPETSPTAYEILGVSKDAAQSDIRKAYHALARKWHPDKNQGDEEAKIKMQEINDAYDQVGSPDARAQYDAKLQTAPNTPKGADTSPSTAPNTSSATMNPQQKAAALAAIAALFPKQAGVTVSEFDGVVRINMANSALFNAAQSVFNGHINTMKTMGKKYGTYVLPINLTPDLVNKLSTQIMDMQDHFNKSYPAEERKRIDTIFANMKINNADVAKEFAKAMADISQAAAALPDNDKAKLFEQGQLAKALLEQFNESIALKKDIGKTPPVAPVEPVATHPKQNDLAVAIVPVMETPTPETPLQPTAHTAAPSNHVEPESTKKPPVLATAAIQKLADSLGKEWEVLPKAETRSRHPNTNFTVKNTNTQLEFEINRDKGQLSTRSADVNLFFTMLECFKDLHPNASPKITATPETQAMWKEACEKAGYSSEKISRMIVAPEQTAAQPKPTAPEPVHTSPSPGRAGG